MNELLIKYEKVIDSLFNADKWLNEQGFNDWDDIINKGIKINGKLVNGSEFYNKRMNLLKEAEQIQKDLKKYREAKM